MNKFKKIGIVLTGTILLSSLSLHTNANEKTLDIVKQRGHLRCQVGTPSPGFYQLSENGEWSGSDVAVCRAIASAIFGDPNKVEFQSVTAAIRFASIANGDSDVLVQTTTWTLFRDTNLGLDFTTVNFYDGQGFMVPKNTGIKSAKELKGATVCVLTGTTTELNLNDYSRAFDLDIKSVVFEDENVRDDTYLKGGCDAVTNDKSGLASSRAKFPNAEEHLVLPETISKEPLGPVVRQNDSQWNDIVMWTVFAMIAAEEYGINSNNVDLIKTKPTNPEISRLLGLEGDLHKGLGLDKDWAYNIIKMVGNYGQVYEKYLGTSSPKALGIPRAGSANDLWTRGGLMYSPPFR